MLLEKSSKKKRDEEKNGRRKLLTFTTTHCLRQHTTVAAVNLNNAVKPIRRQFQSRQNAQRMQRIYRVGQKRDILFNYVNIMTYYETPDAFNAF